MKRKYKRTTLCTCGGRLEEVMEVMYRVNTLITKKGELAKRSRTSSCGENLGPYWLACVDCYKEYDYDEWSDFNHLLEYRGIDFYVGIDTTRYVADYLENQEVE